MIGVNQYEVMAIILSVHTVLQKAEHPGEESKDIEAPVSIIAAYEAEVPKANHQAWMPSLYTVGRSFTFYTTYVWSWYASSSSGAGRCHTSEPLRLADIQERRCLQGRCDQPL